MILLDDDFDALPDLGQNPVGVARQFRLCDSNRHSAFHDTDDSGILAPAPASATTQDIHFRILPRILCESAGQQRRSVIA